LQRGGASKRRIEEMKRRERKKMTELMMEAAYLQVLKDDKKFPAQIMASYFV